MSASWPDTRQRVARNHHFLVGRDHPYRYGTVGGADSRPTPEIGGLKEPRGDVRRVAEALSHLKFLLVGAECGPNAERGVQGTARVVLVGDVSTEECHDPVAEKLVHRALVPMYLGEHELERPLHQTVDLFGIQALGQGGEPRNVDKADDHLLALVLQCAFGGENLLGEVLRGVGLGGGKARPSRSPALVAELGSGGKFNAAGGALPGQASTAVQAELGLRRGVVLTLGTLSPGPPT